MPSRRKLGGALVAAVIYVLASLVIVATARPDQREFVAGPLAFIGVALLALALYQEAKKTMR